MPYHQRTSGSPSSAQWRLIRSPASSAAFNMALDEALLSSTAQKRSLPTLRLYSWSVPSLSLGYAQPASDVDLNELNARGWQLVRRPTGGKAILHTDELTYSVTAPLDDPLVSGSLLESYQRISIALQKALTTLGTPTSADDNPAVPPAQSKTDPVCFQTPSNYEITWNGKKLIGSAQARKLGGVLQHGSLPLCGDLSRITQVLAYPNLMERQNAAIKTLAQATTLEGASGRSVSYTEAAEAIILSFSAQFGISFIQDEPSQDELEITNDLMREKYDSDSWNFRL
ncbi:lipoate--protein ligase family protein [bacterium]|nr:lipoate--protein ligase family protein [bacterium]